jgi:hypothetical protein
MLNNIQTAAFEQQKIRRVYDEEAKTWYFSVVDIIQVLVQQPDYQTARKYWNKLKERLTKEGSEVVTKCHQLKMIAGDGKMRLTDVATAETLLRLVQSVPSPKAEPIKLWLARVGYQRMEEMADPALSVDRARAMWEKHGRSKKWIQQRMMGQETRNKLTDYWKEHDIMFPPPVGMNRRRSDTLGRRVQSYPQRPGNPLRSQVFILSAWCWMSPDNRAALTCTGPGPRDTPPESRFE